MGDHVKLLKRALIQDFKSRAKFGTLSWRGHDLGWGSNTTQERRLSHTGLTRRERRPAPQIPSLKSHYCREFQIHLSLKHICNSFIPNQTVGFQVSQRSAACFAVIIDFYGALVNSLTSLAARLAPPETHKADQSGARSRTFSALQIQINTGQLRSTSKISVQTDKYIKSRQLLTVLHGKTQKRAVAVAKGSLSRCEDAHK